MCVCVCVCVCAFTDISSASLIKSYSICGTEYLSVIVIVFQLLQLLLLSS